VEEIKERTMSEPINDGGPAYPQHGWTKDPEVLERMRNQGGMTLRDWFAGQALAGLLASHEINMPFDVVAPMAYRHADAMLEARGGAK
jgi:hypothetical protein